MYEVSYNKWEHAVTQLLILATFFAMRSCEFLQTSHHEESKRTKIIRLKNIIFREKGRTIQHSTNISSLSSAELVLLTFEFQKNEWRNHSVHMWRTDDKLLCPVKAATKIVKRIHQIPGYSMSISTYPTWGKYRLFHPGVTQFQSQTVVSIKMTVCAQTVLAHTVCTKICTYYESHKVQIFSVAFSNLTV